MLAVAALAVLLTAGTHRASSATKPNTACSTECTCRTRLLKRLNFYQEMYNTGLQRLRDNQLHLLKLILAAEAASKPVALRLLPVIEAGQSMAETCETALKPVEAKLQAASIAVGEALGAYSGSIRLRTHSGTAQTTFNSDLQYTDAKMTVKTLGGLSAAKCAEKDDTEDAIKITEESEKTEPDPTGGVDKVILTSKCDANGGSSSCDSTALTTNGVFGVGLKYTTEPKADHTGWRQATHTYGEINAAAIDVMEGNHTAAHKALNDLRDATKLKPCNARVTEYADVSTQSNFRLMVLKALAGKPTAEETASKDDAIITSAINKNYGDGGASFEANVWSAVKNTNAPQVTNDKEKNDKIENIVTASTLGNSLVRILVKKLTAVQKDDTKEQVSEPKTTDCGGITEKNQCEKKDGCKYNDKEKKCEEDPAKATTATKGDKTNSTGSNSFVIKKAPLLLAFLLF
uniref:Variant surface glycoprotein 660 n=1 Tax=Trypanosoma brucei TaxID=5691 RepID=M4TDT5_9TRYP|nr:variant surface glycoprotein 660 [Trypanosoma brucei]